MNQLTILKIGGKLLENEPKLKSALTDFSLINTPKILVHGGGKRASQLCEKLGIEPKMWNGRRITDEPTLEVVTMVYAGLLNKKVVSQLQAIGCHAMGFSGADGNTILAKKRALGEIDFGFAGDIVKVNKNLIISILKNSITPVFCPITHNGKGQLLNTNADTIATCLAIALADHFKVNLKYCFEKKGVLTDSDNDHSFIEHLNETTYQNHLQTGIISDGMIPKLDNAFSAKKAGVASVMVCGLEGIQQNKGTLIC